MISWFGGGGREVGRGGEARENGDGRDVWEREEGGRGEGMGEEEENGREVPFLAMRIVLPEIDELGCRGTKRGANWGGREPWVGPRSVMYGFPPVLDS